MVIVIDSFEPLVVVRGDAARRVIDQANLAQADYVGGASFAAPANAVPGDFVDAMRRVEAEVYDAA